MSNEADEKNLILEIEHAWNFFQLKDDLYLKTLFQNSLALEQMSTLVKPSPPAFGRTMYVYFNSNLGGLRERLRLREYRLRYRL